MPTTPSACSSRLPTSRSPTAPGWPRGILARNNCASARRQRTCIAIHRKPQTRRAAEDSTRLYGEAAQHRMRLSGIAIHPARRLTQQPGQRLSGKIARHPPDHAQRKHPAENDGLLTRATIPQAKAIKPATKNRKRRVGLDPPPQNGLIANGGASPTLRHDTCTNVGRPFMADIKKCRA